MRDLEDLAGYIAEGSEQNALLVESRVLESARLLSLLPGAGRPGRVKETRELIVLRTPYLLVYRLGPNEIRVLRVYHGARRWPARFD
jgi:plasmid stabilization system protein ParE